MKEPPVTHDQIEQRLGAMATPPPPIPSSLYGYVRGLPGEYPMSYSRRGIPLWRRPRRRLVTAASAIAAVLVIALGGSLLMQVTKTPPAGLPSGTASATQTGTPSHSATASTPKTTVVWLIGLGTGLTADQLKAESDFVNRYNDTNTDNIFLKETLPQGGDSASSTLTERFAAGQFDIVGPVGIEGRGRFPGAWLSLDAEIAKNKTDLSAYPPALLNTFKNSAGQYEGLPYDEYPAFIYYNKDLFRAAGLPDLPTRVGEKYIGQDWSWDELATIAKQLTVDTSGKTSTDPGFDPSKTQSYGFDTQYIGDLRRFATSFGPGSYVRPDGKTAQIPPAWEQASKWYYDAMWTEHFAPTNAERTAAGMGAGDTIPTGRVAMDLAWLWTINSFGPKDASGYPTSSPAPPYQHWDMGVLPSNNGVTSDPVDTDTFVIHKATKNPDAAYKAMLAIMADPSLMRIYGGMPVDTSQQDAYFKTTQASVDKQFANNPVTWSVLTEMAKYAASPTHLDPTPNYNRAITADQALYAKLQAAGGLSLDAEIAKLKATLQADFNAAP
jgi:ABC-type glycerol-3-phosphate transport system substrate-binding protein